MFKKLLSYRNHNPFEDLENNEEKKKILSKYLDKYYYYYNYFFIVSICFLTILVLYIILFKGLVPKDVILASIKNTFCWQTIVVNLCYFSCLLPSTIMFMYLSDKCVTLRLYAEETFKKLKNK